MIDTAGHFCARRNYRCRLKTFPQRKRIVTYQKFPDRYFRYTPLREERERREGKLYHILPINGFNPDSRLTMIEGNPVT